MQFPGKLQFDTQLQDSAMKQIVIASHKLISYCSTNGMEELQMINDSSSYMFQFLVAV